MNTSGISKLSLEKSKLEEWLCVAQVEAIKIKTGIPDEVGQLANKEEIRLFIVKHYRRLIFLNDKLFHNVSTNDKRPESVDLRCVQKVLCLLIDDLLQFIWMNYAAYCDLDQSISEKAQEIFVKLCRREIFLIKNSDCYQKCELVRITIYPFEVLLKDKRFKLSHHLMYYLIELLRELQNFVKHFDDERALDSFVKRLIYINFNFMYFKEYLISLIQKEINSMETYTEKIDKLYWILKIVNQTPIKQGRPFAPRQQEVKPFINE